MSDSKVIFWALAITGCFLLGAIISIGKAIKSYVSTDDFQKKLTDSKKNKLKEGIKNGGKTLGLIFAFFTLTSMSSASPAEAADSSLYSSSNIYALLIIDIFLVGFLLYYKNLFNKFYNINKKEEELPQLEDKVKETTGKVTQFLTDTVAIEDEASILMDHNYDGIEELDNNLPPWWKFGFYLTIVIGVIYLFNYHILKVSPLQEEEYAISIQEAEVEVAQYLKDQALNVDENSVEVLTDGADINKGLILFNQYCTACHMEGGAGNVGPNLTDDYWLYGGDIKGIFKTIKYGAKNGMKSWKDELNPVQIQQVASYITTLRGTNPPNGKEPQGTLVSAEVAVADSLTAQ